MIKPLPCVGAWGRLFGHRYVATFDEIRDGPRWVIELLQRGGFLHSNSEPLAQDTIRIFAGCLCTRCGHVIRPTSGAFDPSPAARPAP